MKVLVATALTQGQRGNDYFHSVEGELVFILRPCARDVLSADGPCGCGRGFAGLVSAKATTTARVAELPDVDRGEYIAALRVGLEGQGYPGYWAEGMADDLTELILSWVTGTVVERRLDEIRPRVVVPTAEPAAPAAPTATSTRRGSSGNAVRPAKQEAAIPSAALARISAMLEIKCGPEKDRMFLDLLISGRDVTIMQHWARVSLQPDRHEAWLAKSVARLRYLKSRGVWQMYCGECKGKWSVYPYQGASSDIQLLLNEIQMDEHHLFWW